MSTRQTPAPRLARGATALARSADKNASASATVTSTSSSTLTPTSWVPVPEEENTRYLPNETPLKPYILTQFISNAGAAVPKTSRRRPYTPAERQRVANTRKYGACKDCKARKITCGHVPPPPPAAIHDYLRETQQHEIFALALNTPSSAANVNGHKESMTKQIADIGDKLPQARNDQKLSGGTDIDAVAEDTASKAAPPPTSSTSQAAQLSRNLNLPLKVCNVPRARSPSRAPQPGTGKFRVLTESSSAKFRVKRQKSVAPGTPSGNKPRVTAAVGRNVQASPSPAVISHNPPSSRADVRQSASEWPMEDTYIFISEHSFRVPANQYQHRISHETRVATSDPPILHQNMRQSLMRRDLSSSGRDSSGSDMGDMVMSSALSASSSGEFRPPTPASFDNQICTVVGESDFLTEVIPNIASTAAAVPTDCDVTENTSAQPFVLHQIDEEGFSYTDFLIFDDNLPDEDMLDRESIAGFNTHPSSSHDAANALPVKEGLSKLVRKLPPSLPE